MKHENKGAEGIANLFRPSYKLGEVNCALIKRIEGRMKGITPDYTDGLFDAQVDVAIEELTATTGKVGQLNEANERILALELEVEVRDRQISTLNDEVVRLEGKVTDLTYLYELAGR